MTMVEQFNLWLTVTGILDRLREKPYKNMLYVGDKSNQSELIYLDENDHPEVKPEVNFFLLFSLDFIFLNCFVKFINFSFKT